jgi:hypothetical protein
MWGRRGTGGKCYMAGKANLVAGSGDQVGGCSDEPGWVSEARTGYFRMGPVLRASCFNRRTCVR